MRPPAPELTGRPIKKLTYLFGEGLARQIHVILYATEPSFRASVSGVRTRNGKYPVNGILSVSCGRPFLDKPSYRYHLPLGLEGDCAGRVLNITPLQKDQELVVAATLAGAYWEGDSAVSGVIDGLPVKGVSYAEVAPVPVPGGTPLPPAAITRPSGSK
jgi:hypothetical protein